MESARPLPTSGTERFFQFSLLGMLATGYAAIASSGSLDGISQAAALIALAARAAVIAGWMRPPNGPRASGIATLACLLFYALDYLFISPTLIAATIHLTFFLGGLKLIGARANRDYAYLKTIAGLELLAAAVLSAGLTFFAFLAVFLLFAVATFSSGEIRNSIALMNPANAARNGPRRLARRLGWFSFALCAGIVILTAGMFFVLPRTARAAMGRFASGRYHMPGFTREITLGEFGEMREDSRPVMHVRTYGGESLAGVRWKGAALSQFDGVRWFAPPGQDVPIRVEQGTLILSRVLHGRPGRNLSYRVQLEEAVADTLFFAGTPEAINIDLPAVRISPGSGSIRVPRMANGIAYSARSFLEDEAAPASGQGVRLRARAREETLRLPHLDPRIPALAQAMTEGARSDAEAAQLLEEKLRRDYAYSLELPRQAPADPLADFLFVRKKGYCEYFASAMAVMLRTLGIPSRVVTGFQSGVFNPMTGAQLVRASDAHSWVEAWIEGTGWTTFDPTPADPHAPPPQLTGISMWMDTADQFWRNWVVGYDLPRQSALAVRIREAGETLRLPALSAWISTLDAAARRIAGNHRVWMFVSALCAAILAFAIWSAVRNLWRRRAEVLRLERGEGHPSDATMLYRRMLGLLERRGFHKPAHATPSEFARALPVSEMSPLVEDLTSAYNRFRFGGRGDLAPHIIRLLERLENLQAHSGSVVRVEKL